MNHQPRKQLTVIQIMLLVALLGIALTVAVSLWDGPSGADSANVDAEIPYGSSQSQ